MPGSQQDPAPPTPLAAPDGPAGTQPESTGTPPAAPAERPRFDFQPVDERSAGRLVVLLRQRDELLACSHSFDEFEKFMREIFIPEFNAISRGSRMCVECGLQFKASHPRRRFCSNSCSSRVRARGRRRPEVQRELKKRAIARVMKPLKDHWAKCPHCLRARECAAVKLLMAKATKGMAKHDERFALLPHDMKVTI